MTFYDSLCNFFCCFLAAQSVRCRGRRDVERFAGVTSQSRDTTIKRHLSGVARTCRCIGSSVFDTFALLRLLSRELPGQLRVWSERTGADFGTTLWHLWRYLKRTMWYSTLLTYFSLDTS